MEAPHDLVYREKAYWELNKDATSYIEQIPEATSYKTAAVRPSISHLKNYTNKMDKACGTLPEK